MKNAGYIAKFTKAELIELKEELTALLSSEQASLDWWKNEMGRDYDGYGICIKHHSKQIKRIKKILKALKL